VDVIVAVIISSYWQNSRQFAISLIVISTVWIIAFLLADNFKVHEFSPYLEGALYIAGGFILSVFIHKPHKPHKPIIHCDSCQFKDKYGFS